jgi:hypothetical protein
MEIIRLAHACRQNIALLNSIASVRCCPSYVEITLRLLSQAEAFRIVNCVIGGVKSTMDDPEGCNVASPDSTDGRGFGRRATVRPDLAYQRFTLLNEKRKVCYGAD